MNKVGKALVAVAALFVVALVAAGPAAAQDRNNDRIPDKWEKRHDLSLKVNQAKRDQDSDSLNNRGEFRSNSDPRDADTDDDGTEDGDENAGVVSSFDGTTLTIDLLNGGSITGTVDQNTEVKCGDECNGDGEHHAHGDHSGPGDGLGPHEHGDGHDDDDADVEEVEDDLDSDAEEGTCSIDDIVEGVAIHEAEIQLKNGDAFFEEIELAK